jgi:hypothetical protein
MKSFSFRSPCEFGTCTHIGWKRGEKMPWASAMWGLCRDLCALEISSVLRDSSTCVLPQFVCFLCSPLPVTQCLTTIKIAATRVSHFFKTVPHLGRIQLPIFDDNSLSESIPHCRRFIARSFGIRIVVTRPVTAQWFGGRNQTYQETECLSHQVDTASRIDWLIKAKN